MGRIRLAAALAATALLAVPAFASATWKPGPEKYGVGEHADVPVRMSDGTVLRANVFYPTVKGGAAAKGPFPVIMVQTPYGKDAAGQASGGNGIGDASTEIGPLPYMIKRGYIDVAVDIRGTGDSHGTFNLLDPQIGRDGAELVDWAARLPHSSGKVGTYGPSYMGIDQLMTAYNVGRHSPLKAIFPIVAGNDAYRDIAFQGGMPGIEFDLVILVLFGGLNVGNPPIADYGDLADLLQVEAEHVASLLSYNAYQGLNILAGGDQAFYGKYWRARTQRKMLATIVHNHIPAFMIGGWFDLFQRGTPLNYSGLQNAWAGRSVAAPMKPDQKVTGRYQLVDGPWYHLDSGTGFPTYPVQLAWYDHFLKGQNTGITDTKHPLHLYELRSNHWHDATRYPLDQAPAKTFYLDAGPSGSGAPSTNDGTLAGKRPAAEEGADQVEYVGGASPCSRQTDQWGAGPTALALETGNLPSSPCSTDDRTIQSGPGALTYTTAPLKRDVPLAGPIDATIYATSTRPDVELEATLEDVAPGGASFPLTSGALLGSFRELDYAKTWRGRNGRPLIPYHPYTKASKTLVETGKVTRFDIEVFPTFAELDKGHRLRVTLTTSDSPHLLPLPADTANLDGGVYQVQRNASHASFINVPLAKEGSFSPCGICK
jgi:putative CocE/NonD family hydrolase